MIIANTVWHVGVQKIPITVWVVDNIARDGSMDIFDTSCADFIPPGWCDIESDITQYDRINVVNNTARLTDRIAVFV